MALAKAQRSGGRSYVKVLKPSSSSMLYKTTGIGSSSASTTGRAKAAAPAYKGAGNGRKRQMRGGGLAARAQARKRAPKRATTYFGKPLV